MGHSASRRYAPAQSEPMLPRGERRAQGIYYTPPEVVQQLVRLTLDQKLTRRASESKRTRHASAGVAQQTIRILDPACGAGAMLAGTQAQLGSKVSLQLIGVDLDPAAILLAQSALPTASFLHGDALCDARVEALAPFDAIVGNPPFVNIRQLARTQPADYVERLRQRFRTARGNFDLYVPFVERAWELLAPSGRCGLVLPNKWATLDYARPLRALLLAETTIEHVVDLSAERVFAEASVYPHLLIFTKRRPARSHFVRCHVNASAWTCPQRTLSPSSIALSQSLDVESRVESKPLGELATISCGTPGYSAERVAGALHEASEWDGTGDGLGGRGSRRAERRETTFDFITSGNIDRYEIKLGNVRFLGRKYDRPVLPLDAPALTDGRRRLFAGPKIVVAGLSQRLEAAWDDRGLALGVQVFALSEFQIDPQYLLALLNSRLLTYLFRTRFAAKRLAGGYLAINKGQLAQLPIAIPRRTSVSVVPATGQAGHSSHDARLDQRVYRLYGLTNAEIATVEQHFANLGRRAA